MVRPATRDLQGDILAPFLLIICLDYVLQMSMDLIKENGFALRKARSRIYLAEAITGADYSDDLTLVINSPIQAESQLHSLNQVTRCLTLHEL